ncbi:MAG: NADH-quinone oxidoreductase subunit C [Infirmifilum sp.]
MSGVEEAKSIGERFAAKGLEVKVLDNRVRVFVSPDRLREVAEEALNLGFDHLASIEGIDWPPLNAIEVVYHAESYSENLRNIILEVRVKLPRENPALPSLIDVWPNAILLERETWEMLGVVFQGNPDLRHLLLPPDWSDIPPLRKDYKVVEEGVYVNLE